VYNLFSINLDLLVIAFNDGRQQTTSAAEVVMERRRVLLTRVFDDLFERRLVHAVARE
jgi:hypothetical protein